MPFRSQSQARYMFAKHPSIAREFASKTPSIKALPEKVAHHKTHTKMHKEHPIHKHSSAHDEMSVAEMAKHHMSKMPVEHPSHPDHKHYKAAITNVRHADGSHKTMHVGGHGK